MAKSLCHLQIKVNHDGPIYDFLCHNYVFKHSAIWENKILTKNSELDLPYRGHKNNTYNHLPNKA